MPLRGRNHNALIYTAVMALILATLLSREVITARKSTASANSDRASTTLLDYQLQVAAAHEQ